MYTCLFSCSMSFYMYLLELVVLYIVYKTKCYLQYHILYEIYDCVLQYVQISAYSHNLQINNNFIILYLHVSTIYQIQDMSVYMSLGLYMFHVLPYNIYKHSFRL